MGHVDVTPAERQIRLVKTAELGESAADFWRENSNFAN